MKKILLFLISFVLIFFPVSSLVYYESSPDSYYGDFEFHNLSYGFDGNWSTYTVHYDDGQTHYLYVNYTLQEYGNISSANITLKYQADLGLDVYGWNYTLDDWSLFFSPEGSNLKTESGVIPPLLYSQNPVMFKIGVKDDLGGAAFFYENNITINANTIVPNVSSVVINSTNPSVNDTNSDIIISFVPFDADDVNVLTCDVEWMKDDVIFETYYNISCVSDELFESVLSSANFSQEDVISAGVRVFDGTEYSSWSNSTGLTVINQNPSFLSTLIGAFLRGFSGVSYFGEGLVGYWEFERNATDMSGNGNDGSPVGVTNTTSGRVANAFKYNSSSGSQVSFSDVLGRSNVSFGFWFSPSGGGSAYSFVNGEEIDVVMQGNELRFFSGFGGMVSSVTNSWDDGKWYSIIGTYDDVSHTQRVWVDGVLEGEGVFTSLFEFQDSVGNVVARWDVDGNLSLAGTCTASADCTMPAGDNDLIFQDGSGNVVAYVDETGDLCIEDSNCNDQDATCEAYPDGSFVLQNGHGRTMSYISGSGDVCLIGGLNENEIF